MVYSQGIHPCDQLPGFIAYQDSAVLGVLTYLEKDHTIEIVSLDSLRERQGVGTALLQAVEKKAQAQQITRLWLITTNDNLNALRFYQKRGYELVRLDRNAVQEARRIKPQIPLIGHDGIPIRDEIELEKLLGNREEHERDLPF